MIGNNVLYRSCNGNGVIFCEAEHVNAQRLYEAISQKVNIPINEFKIEYNSRLITCGDASVFLPNVDISVNVHHALVGGKGGFGSMLRAIGAQIEKTTNKEACRDLSGRRLRDVNAEKRIKKWITKQAEKAKQRDKRKIEKLEKLKRKPKIDFDDQEYLKSRQEIPESVDNAIEYAFKRAKIELPKPQVSATVTCETVVSSVTEIEESKPSTCGNNDLKRKPTSHNKKEAKKNKALAFFGDIDDEEDEDEDENDEVAANH